MDKYRLGGRDQETDNPSGKGRKRKTGKAGNIKETRK